MKITENKIIELLDDIDIDEAIQDELLSDDKATPTKT